MFRLLGGALSQSLLLDIVFSVVDVETTGLSAQRDRVTEVAVVQVQNGQIIHTYSSLINPECPIPPFIQQMTGISDAMVQGAPLFKQVCPSLERLLAGTVLVAHNARFDKSFLAAEFGRCQISLPELSVVDTVSLARRTVQGLTNYKLETLCGHFGFEAGGHRALSDALVTAKILLELMKAGADERLALTLRKVVV